MGASRFVNEFQEGNSLVNLGSDVRYIRVTSIKDNFKDTFSDFHQSFARAQDCCQVDDNNRRQFLAPDGMLENHILIINSQVHVLL